jgi:hypothetical protein
MIRTTLPRNTSPTDLARQRLDHRYRLRGCLAVGGGDEHPAIVLDIDCRASLVDDPANGLATWADQRADLLGVDLQVMIRGAYGDSSARGSGSLSSCQDEQPALALACANAWHMISR